MDAVDRDKPQYPPARNLTGVGLGLDASGMRIFSSSADPPKTDGSS